MARKTTSTTKTEVKPRRTTPVKTKSTVVESAPTHVIRPRKTIFRAGTLAVVLLLLAMIELTVYLKQQKEKTGTGTPTVVSEAAPIFNAEDGAATSIEIKPTDSGKQSVKVARDAKNAWAIVMPLEAEADQGLAEAAATQISALQAIRPMNGKPGIFGLETPAYVITIEFKSGKTHTLEVGDATPSNSGYYVRIDKDKMVIADLSGIQSLLQLVAAPPYLHTPTPTSLPPTETPVPPTETGGTPTPTP